MMQHNKLEILHLTKRFGEKTLFEDLNLTVEEPAVLWAPSGWGKTTLLRVLMGLETPTSGSVQGVGRVSAVFQEDRLCPQLNAVQNVALVLPGPEAQYKEFRKDLNSHVETLLPPPPYQWQHRHKPQYP